MNVDVAVVTAAIPDRVRESMLGRALRSVRDQYLRPREHLVGVDYEGVGPVRIRNSLAQTTGCEWLMFLDDDDALLPWHFEKLWPHTTDADVVHSGFQVEGREGWTWDTIHDQGCSTLTPVNSIPMTALVRREAFLDVGGFGDLRPEDLHLWSSLKDAGARFACVHEITWVYRFHTGNASIERERDGRMWWG